MKIRRTDRSLFADWWWTIDRWLLTALLALLLVGLVMVMAASPPIAARLNLSEFHFVQRQVVYAFGALTVLFVVSLLSVRQIRRLSLIIAVVGFGLLVVALGTGSEVKGATRWIDLGVMSLQPSEFVKPAFVVLCAWLFSESARRSDVPGNALAVAFFAALIILLMLQPDFGQSVLISLVWATMFFLAGLPLIWILSLLLLAVAGVTSAYLMVPHVTTRMDRFFQPSGGDTYQVDVALRAFYNGGWFGAGPGEGTVKRVLPDAHSDFVFAVMGEEFGVIACLILVALYGFIAIRGLARCGAEPDPFIRLAVAGLTALFGYQALINMGVALSVLPAKGMTLPFVSYGGSSLLSVAFGMGVVLALTRRRAGRTAPDARWTLGAPGEHAA